MNNDPNVGLGVQQVNNQGSREWQDLMIYLGGAWSLYPATYTEEKTNNALAAGVINVFERAAARVNADGLVVMRGLIKKSSTIAVGDVIMGVPKNLLPLSPHQKRFIGGTCTITYDPNTKQLKVDYLLGGAADYVFLNNVIYYKD